MVVLRGAREQLAELTGMTPESVSSFERTDDGWSLEVESSNWPVSPTR
ncbi:hypothetical protein SALBM135S_05956 [Streptomyces alboniger]